MELTQIDDYRQLFLHDVPMMDVRAPVAGTVFGKAAGESAAAEAIRNAE